MGVRCVLTSKYQLPMCCGHLERTTQQLSAQDLARCDYFSESQENAGPDIYKVVGAIAGLITVWPMRSGRHEERLASNEVPGKGVCYKLR